METISFTKQDTCLVKGVGAILLMLHHIIGGDPGTPIDIFHTTISVIEGTESKVCVSLFMVLSGYGMLEMSKKMGACYRTVMKRLWKLYTHFWGAWIVLFIWSSVRGYRPLTDFYFLGLSSDGPIILLRDLFGFNIFMYYTPTINGVFWFVEAIVICYLLFPIFAFFLRKNNVVVHVFLLLLTYSPWIYYQYKQDYSMHTDRALFYIFSFYLGMVLSRYKILSKIKELAMKWPQATGAVSLAILAIAIVVRSRLCLIFDPFFAVSICAFVISTFCTHQNYFPVGTDFLNAVGKIETDLYYLHPVLIAEFTNISFSSLFARCFFSILLCIAIIYSYVRAKDYMREKIQTAIKAIANKRVRV